MVVLAVVYSIPKPKNTLGYPLFLNDQQEDIQKITLNIFDNYNFGNIYIVRQLGKISDRHVFLLLLVIGKYLVAVI